MKLQTIILAVFLTYVSCDEAKVSVLKTEDFNGNENEIISIDLKKKDGHGSEEIKLIAQMRIHLIEGKVHLNGNILEHGVVNHVHMRLRITEFEHGIQKEPELKPVRLRVLIIEKPGLDGSKTLIVEEEFMQVGEYEVIQVDVKQIIFESMVRKPITLISLQKSEIHARAEENDHHVVFKDDGYHPLLPIHPMQGKDYRHHSCHHHHGHHGKHSHNVFRRTKCWYHSLSWKAKFALFSTGFLLLITFILFCAICAKRRQQRRHLLQVTAPMDDSVAVDMDQEKKEKSSDDKLEFHFEFANDVVVVDDKKNLIE